MRWSPRSASPHIYVATACAATNRESENMETFCVSLSNTTGEQWSPKVTCLKSETGLKNLHYIDIYLHAIFQQLDSFFISDGVIRG